MQRGLPFARPRGFPLGVCGCFLGGPAAERFAEGVLGWSRAPGSRGTLGGQSLGGQSLAPGEPSPSFRFGGPEATQAPLTHVPALLEAEGLLLLGRRESQLLECKRKPLCLPPPPPGLPPALPPRSAPVSAASSAWAAPRCLLSLSAPGCGGARRPHGLPPHHFSGTQGGGPQSERSPVVSARASWAIRAGCVPEGGLRVSLLPGACPAWLEGRTGLGGREKAGGQGRL